MYLKGWKKLKKILNMIIKIDNIIGECSYYGPAKHTKFVNGSIYKLSTPYAHRDNGIYIPASFVILAYNKQRTKNMLFVGNALGDTVKHPYYDRPCYLKEAQITITECGTSIPLNNMFELIGYKLITKKYD